MKKIALVLQRTIGDVILGNVLVKNIKLKYPDSTIDWFVNSEYNSLVEDNPNVSTIVNLKDWEDVLRRICMGYDVVLVPQQTNAIDNSWHQHEEYRHKHLLDFYAQRCDIPIVDRKIELFANDALEGDWSHLQTPTVAIHTKTLADVKDWSKFTELVKELNKKNYSVIQLGTKSDIAIDGATKVTLSLKEIMLFFKEKSCNIFVGLDSGLTYISAAFGTPTIQIMGATTNVTSGAWGNDVVTLLSEQNKECVKQRKGIRCHGILGGKCQFGGKCINNISVGQVLNEIKNNI